MLYQNFLDTQCPLLYIQLSPKRVLINSIGKEIVLTFEDLHVQGRAMGPLPNGYAGLTWSGSAWFVTKQFLSSVCPGVPFGLLNAQGHDLTIESEHPFDLRTLSPCTLWRSTKVLVEGWEKEARKYATTVAARQISPVRFDLDYRAVDRVALRIDGAHIVVDTITMLLPSDFSQSETCQTKGEEPCRRTTPTNPARN